MTLTGVGAGECLEVVQSFAAAASAWQEAVAGSRLGLAAGTAAAEPPEGQASSSLAAAAGSPSSCLAIAS